MPIVAWLILTLSFAGCALRLPPPVLDPNTADLATLAQLPGLSTGDAERIVANRPYAKKDDLLRRGILTPVQYKAVADQLDVGAAMPDYLLNVPPEAESP